MTRTPPALVASRYRIGAPLGTGGMATVFDAVDERLQRRVAVKVLRPEMAAQADVRARFEQEARSAAQLTHPNVVAVFDTGEDDGTPFLVMERLPGETLADRMRAGPVETAWLLRVAGDVLGALGAAHAAGIVHRDVKPGNILIGADGCAKVGDFGIAKSLEVAAAADLTSTNQLIGTPAYVAPERMAGQPATRESDLYAVGVVLYEALAGRKPFTGITPVATAYAVQHETPPPLASLRPDLPPGVVAAVERAMDRDPARRFATAADLAGALGVGVAGGAATASVPDDDATVVAAGATQVLPVAPRAAPAPPPRAHARRRVLLLAAGALATALLLFALAASAGDDGGGGGADDDAPPATTISTPSTLPTTVPTTATSTTAPPPPAAAGEGDGEDTEAPAGKGAGRGKRKDD